MNLNLESQISVVGIEGPNPLKAPSLNSCPNMKKKKLPILPDMINCFTQHSAETISGEEKSKRKDSDPLMVLIQTEVARKSYFLFTSKSLNLKLSASVLCSATSPNIIDYTCHA